MSLRLKLYLAFVLVAVGVLAVPAVACASAWAVFPMADFVSDLGPKIIEKIANWLVPGWAQSDKGRGMVQWLVAVPNPSQASRYGHINTLYLGMRSLAAGLLSLTAILTIFRYYMSGLTGRSHPVEALPRILLAAGFLVAYKWCFEQVTALVNIITKGILSWEVVGEGATTSVGAMMQTGAAGPMVLLLLFVACICIALMVMKVALLVLFSILFVIGPVAIALYPLPELSHIAKGWAMALLSLALIPIGWCVIFATAGALSSDLVDVHGSTSSVEFMGKKLLAGITGFLTFFLAYKWPLIILGQVKGFAGHFGISGSPGGGVSRVAGTAVKMAGFAKVASSLSAARGGSLGAAGIRGSSSANKVGSTACSVDREPPGCCVGPHGEVKQWV